jgi:hypothetical protein
MSSPPQRIITGIGAVIIVVLTIVAAYFLTNQDQRVSQEITPTVSPTVTILPSIETPILTETLLIETPVSTETLTPTETSTSTPSPTETALPSTETSIPTETTLPSTETSIPTETATSEPTPTDTVVRHTDCQRTPLEWVDYSVERGDDWESLSQRVGLSPFDLQQANCRTSTLRPGEFVFLPFAPPTPTPTDTRVPEPTATSIPRAAATPISTPTPAKPMISQVTPHDGQLGQEVRLFVFGENLGLLDEHGIRTDSGLSVELIMIEPNSQSVSLKVVRASSTDLEAIIPASLPEGCYDLLVVNPSSPTKRSDIVEKAYTNNPLKYICLPNVTPTPSPTNSPTPTSVPQPPRIINCIPVQGVNDEDVTIECTGQSFASNDTGFLVELRKSNTSIRLEVTTGTDTNFKAIIKTGIEVGVYDLVVTNPDKRSDIRRDAYTVVLK